MLMVLLILILDIFTNHFRIKANGIHTITSGPEMVIPVGFFLQPLKLVENPYGGSIFQCLY